MLCDMAVLRECVCVARRSTTNVTGNGGKVGVTGWREEGEEGWKDPRSWDTGFEPRIIIGERGIRNTEPPFFLQRQSWLSKAGELAAFPFPFPFFILSRRRRRPPVHHHHHQRPFWTSKKARTAALSGVHSPNANARTLARTLPFWFRSNTGA